MEDVDECDVNGHDIQLWLQLLNLEQEDYIDNGKWQ